MVVQIVQLVKTVRAVNIVLKKGAVVVFAIVNRVQLLIQLQKNIPFHIKKQVQRIQNLIKEKNKIMKQLFVLQGTQNSGKTTTIKILNELLLVLKSSYELSKSNFDEKNHDFNAIYIKNGKKIGITSSGDTYDLVNDRLLEFDKEDCEICICACHTYDRIEGEGPIGSIANFKKYQHNFIPKTKTDKENVKECNLANENDAINLFQHIENAI